MTPGTLYSSVQYARWVYHISDNSERCWSRVASNTKPYSKGPPGRPGLQVHGRAGLDYSSVHFNACTRITREAAESSGYSGSSNTKQFQSKDDVNVTAATKYDYYIGANVSGPQRYASLETRRSLENVISCDHYSNKPDLLRPLLRGERSIRRLQTAVSRVRT